MLPCLEHLIKLPHLSRTLDVEWNEAEAYAFGGKFASQVPLGRLEFTDPWFYDVPASSPLNDWVLSKHNIRNNNPGWKVYGRRGSTLFLKLLNEQSGFEFQPQYPSTLTQNYVRRFIGFRHPKF